MYTKSAPSQECSEAIAHAKRAETILLLATLLADVKDDAERVLADEDDSRIEILKETLSSTDLDEATIVEIGALSTLTTKKR